MQPYAYYLCHTKSCASYGKSIPRDKLEGDVGEIIKSLRPSHPLMDLVKVMFRQAWDQRLAQANDAKLSGQRKIKSIEKQIEVVLTRVLEATNASVIQAYEGKIADLESAKLRLTEQLANSGQPKGTFDERLEPALKFLASPWKIWKIGHTTLRRAVLRLAFRERLAYHRIEGARTPNLSLPFKHLGGRFSP